MQETDNFNDALEKYSKEIELNDKDPELLKKRGNFYIQSKRYENA